MTKKLTISICKQIAKLSFKIEEMKEEGVSNEVSKLEDQISDLESHRDDETDALEELGDEINDDPDLTDEEKKIKIAAAEKATTKTLAALDKKIEKLRGDIDKAEELQSYLDDTMSALMSAAEELAGNMDYEFDAYAA